MKKRYSAVADLDSKERCCPFCSKPYLPLDYYSYTGTSENEDPPKYKDLKKHLGGLCPYCYKKNRNRRIIPAGFVILLIGLALFVCGVILPLAGVIPVTLSDYFEANDIYLFGFYKTVLWSNPLMYVTILSFLFIGISMAVIVPFSLEKPEKMTADDISRRRLFSAMRTESKIGSELSFMLPSEAYGKGLAIEDEE